VKSYVYCAVLTGAFAGSSAGTLHSSSMSHRGQSLPVHALKQCHLCHRLRCFAGDDLQVPWKTWREKGKNTIVL